MTPVIINYYKLIIKNNLKLNYIKKIIWEQQIRSDMIEIERDTILYTSLLSIKN